MRRRSCRGSLSLLSLRDDDPSFHQAPRRPAHERLGHDPRTVLFDAPPPRRSAGRTDVRPEDERRRRTGDTADQVPGIAAAAARDIAPSPSLRDGSCPIEKTRATRSIDPASTISPPDEVRSGRCNVRDLWCVRACGCRFFSRLCQTEKHGRMRANASTRASNSLLPLTCVATRCQRARGSPHRRRSSAVRQLISVASRAPMPGTVMLSISEPVGNIAPPESHRRRPPRIEELERDLGGGECHPVELEVALLDDHAVADRHMRNDPFADIRLPDLERRGAVCRHRDDARWIAQVPPRRSGCRSCRSSRSPGRRWQPGRTGSRHRSPVASTPTATRPCSCSMSPPPCRRCVCRSGRGCRSRAAARGRAPGRIGRQFFRAEEDALAGPAAHVQRWNAENGHGHAASHSQTITIKVELAGQIGVTLGQVIARACAASDPARRM